MKACKITNIKGARKLFDNSGSNFTLTTTDYKYVQFFYLAMTGYCVDYSLYYFLAEVSAADEVGVLTTEPVICFSKNSHDIDSLMIDFFEIFPEKRFFSPPIDNGSINTIIKDAGDWFNTFNYLYLDEITAEFTNAKPVKKRRSRKKKIDQQ